MGCCGDFGTFSGRVRANVSPVDDGEVSGRFLEDSGGGFSGDFGATSEFSGARAGRSYIYTPVLGAISERIRASGRFLEDSSGDSVANSRRAATFSGGSGRDFWRSSGGFG